MVVAGDFLEVGGDRLGETVGGGKVLLRASVFVEFSGSFFEL